MINKVTNTQCRSKFLFFSTNSLQKLKQFPFRNFNRDFYASNTFFNGFRRRGWKRTFGARPVGKMNTMFCLFVPRCAFFPEGSDMPILWLKPPFNESRTRVNEQEFTLVWQDSRWVLSLACTFLFFVMSSSRKPACYRFCLWQELPTEGE